MRANRETVLGLIEGAKARGAAILGIFHDDAARGRVCDREIDVRRLRPGPGGVTGRLIAVVGPSGVGKDTLMEAMSRAEPRLALVRRVITRDPALGGEAFEAVSPGRLRSPPGGRGVRARLDGAWAVLWHSRFGQ